VVSIIPGRFDNGRGCRTVPIDCGNTFVGCRRRFSTAKFRPEDDLVGVRCENFVGHGMSHVFGNADKVAKGFRRLRGKAWFLCLVVSTFVESESKKYTNIRSDASKSFNRCTPIEAVGSSVVVDKCRAAKVSNQQPPCSRGTCAVIKNAIAESFDILVSTFREVLVLALAVGLA